jgi:hypothetical protein
MSDTTVKTRAATKAPEDHKGKAPKGKAATPKGKTNGTDAPTEAPKGKTPKAPKLTKREKVAQLRAEAEGKARELRVADAKGKAQAQIASDDAYAAAVLALLDMSKDALADTDRRYIADHGKAVLDMQARAEGRKTEVQAEREAVSKRFATAKSAAAERTRDVAVFFFGLCDVHSIMTQSAASRKYGVAQPSISRYVMTGRIMARFDKHTPTAAVMIHQAAGEKRAELQAAVTANGATFDTVREAVGSVPSRERREAAQGEAETTAVEAARHAVKLTSCLLIMAETGDTFADFAESNGEDVARALLLAIHAYARRTQLPLGEQHDKVLVMPVA